MHFVDLKKHLASGTLKPCYLLIGADGYLLRTATAMFCALVSALPEFNLHCFDESNQAADIVYACKSLPVQEAYSVVVVKNYAKDIKEVQLYLKQPSPQTVLVFVSESLTKNFSAIAHSSEIVDCSRLSDDLIIKWIMRETEKQYAHMSRGGAALLTRYLNGNMAAIEQEICKLCAYKSGGEITEEDIESLVTPDPEYKLYELGDAIVKKKNAEALEILKFLLSMGPATHVISALYAFFRRLLFVSLSKGDRENGKYLGIKEYAVTMAVRQSASYSPKRLKLLCDRLSRLDFDFKSGRIQDRTGLEVFVMQTLLDA